MTDAADQSGWPRLTEPLAEAKLAVAVEALAKIAAWDSYAPVNVDPQPVAREALLRIAGMDTAKAP